MVSSAVRPLSEDLKKIAHLELKEIDSRIDQDIEKLRAWIQKQPHLKARTDAQYLLAFLRGSKHSLEKAKSKIEYFYTIKTLVPEIFNNLRVDKKTTDLILSGVVIWPQNPAGIHGPEVGITRFDDSFDYNRFKLIDLLRFRSLILEYIMNNVDSCVVSGYVEIIDLKKISLSFYAQTDFTLTKKLIVFFEKAVPLRLKGVHIINCPKDAQNILQFVKSIIPEKIRKLILIHKNIEDMHKQIPLECLPKEYGGSNGTIAEIAVKNANILTAFSQYFVENDQFGVDNSLRPNKNINEQSLFGLEGSFRKLEID